MFGEDEVDNPITQNFPGLLEALEDIWNLGMKKYGEDSFQARVLKGDRSRYMQRVTQISLFKHVAEHYQEFAGDVPHDVYGTTKHQLAAAIFNLIMEWHFSDLEHCDLSLEGTNKEKLLSDLKKHHTEIDR